MCARHNTTQVNKNKVCASRPAENSWTEMGQLKCHWLLGCSNILLEFSILIFNFFLKKGVAFNTNYRTHETDFILQLILLC